MTCHDCSENLHDYAADTLAPAERARVEAHLAACPACRAELAAARRLRAAVAALPREIAPRRDLWPELAPQLAPCARAATPAPLLRFLLPLAAAAALALAPALVPPPAARPVSLAAWSVSPLAGSPRVAARPVAGETPFRPGQWLETDAASRARVAVAAIGEVKVQPNSRVRLVGTAPTEHRIELARGAVDALIWAPPRLFFVDTPSATAVDLGCAYTLAVDDAGNGELHVTLGYVALEHAGRESIIPSGAKCITRKGAGPGTPFAAEAPAAFRAALDTFDFGAAAARPAALDTLLALASHDDDVTLWHLLARTSGPARAATYDLLARHSPPPAGVTRAAILAGDRAALRAWATALGLGVL